MSGLGLALLGFGLLAGTGCQIEDRTPTGTRRDEDTIHEILGQYARRLSERDWAGIRSLFWQDGSYSGPVGPTAPSDYHQAVPIDSALRVLQRLLRGVERQNFDVRVLRTDFRQQGDLAAVWIVTRRRTPSGSTSTEQDWFEHIVLRQIDGDWRILSVAVVSSSRGGAR
ncbi:MAG: nuclear transport factor 2 family protein [Gemmatimonadales bacterium]|nr:nuclear transport factor 2 family protein [Gemmatimonadales bacterium]